MVKIICQKKNNIKVDIHIDNGIDQRKIELVNLDPASDKATI